MAGKVYSITNGFPGTISRSIDDIVESFANVEATNPILVGSLLPSVTRAHLQLFLESRMEDKTFVGQHKRKHEFPVVTQISHRN